MSGISSTLSIAKTAITTQQYGLNITGQNIANVNNSDYSIQNADHKNRTPIAYGGFLFGTGVDMVQVQQSVDKLLEQRLTTELSTQASFEEQESYMRILEGFLDVSSDTGITHILTEFWNSWHDLSNNPQGSSERVAVLESGKTLAAGFESAVLKMDALAQDITADMHGAVSRINTLITQIGTLNQKISANEIGRTANDLRDQRNGLLKDLGDLIDISLHEKSDGSVIVNTASSFTLVLGNDTYPLGMKDKQVVWKSASSGQVVISDKILGGRLGGLLEMRDIIIPKYRAEMDALSREMIWAINYQHSQGAGLTYFSEPVVGDYAADDSRWLTSFEFGDKIDPTKAFTLWVEDKTRAETQYTKTNMDMNISQAEISNWQGVAPGGVQSLYKLTVVDDAILGDRQVTETDGDGLARVHGGATVSAALSAAIKAQTLTVYNGPSGTGVIEVKEVGGDAKPSAASIAAALNRVDGVTAYASETSATFSAGDIDGTDEGDLVKFSLVVEGLVFQQEFIRGPSTLAIEEQFEKALRSGVESFNQINDDQDLFVEGLTIASRSGRTLGVQDFEVQDNAGVSLSNFVNFNGTDTITFTIDSMIGVAAVGTTAVSVDLTGVDTSNQSQMALTFSSALTSALAGKPFTIINDLSTNAVTIRTTDGSDIRIRDAGDDTGNNATIDIAALSGTGADGGNVDSLLEFTAAANDTARFNASTVPGNTILFSAQGTQVTINESSAGAGLNKAGVITGTVTLLLEAGMEIVTNVSGPGSGGLFSSSYAQVGSSILTLGGEGGFAGFDPAGGETISFDLDGTSVSFVTVPGGTSDVQLATQLATQIVAGLTAANVQNNYQVIQTNSSVSIIKNKALDDPIKIENFSELSGNNVTLRVRTGTGTGINQPENDLLESDPLKSFRNGSTSSLYTDDGVIMWERFDKNGIRTGATGMIRVEDEGRVTIVEKGLQTLSFDISKGSLVAGNTLTLNTNTSGQPDPLDFRITGRANSINDSYQFKVVSGGKVGHLPGLNDPPLVIEWRNSVKTGTFTIPGNDPPYTPQTPIEVLVDGMNLKFSNGTLFKGDVFTLTTGDTGIPVSLNSAGQPTGEKLSDWHWTLDSFAEQFNRVANGMKASATLDNRLKFQASDTYYALDNIEFSGKNGFDTDNVSLTVKDWSSLNFKAADLRFERSSAGWGVVNDPTGGALQILPPGGDDHGFGVDFSGDGLADIQIRFQEKVSGSGYVEFDLTKKDAKNIGFAFSDNASSDSGLAAAAGINTFFKGYDAMTMEINGALTDTRRIAAAVIDRGTGGISQGDNTNALAMADVQYQERKMILWTFRRGEDSYSSTTIATLDDYFTQMISSMGIKSRTIKNSKEFADMMVNNITEQRNSVSAVSLDEEMIKLMKYQHAFAAASKLLKVSDEMLNTLIAMR